MDKDKEKSKGQILEEEELAMLIRLSTRKLVKEGQMEVVYKHQWEKSIGRLSIKTEQRDSKSPLGRFGGGWNWEFGFQLGGHDLILNLLVFSIRFSLS